LRASSSPASSDSISASLTPDDITADAWRILASRGLRQFAYGLLAVVLAVSLLHDHVTTVQIGVLISVSLAGDFCGTYVIGIFADRWGRRRTLTALALLMAATGITFGLSRFFPLLLVAAFFGTLGASASETAPFLPIEQAMLPQTCPPDRRTDLFARYNLVASFSGALGALTAGLPDLLSHVGVPIGFGLRLMFGVYTVAALAVALLVRRLSPAVEKRGPTPRGPINYWRRLVPPLGSSRNVVLRLAALFSLDAFAGGLVVQSLMVLYFHLRFGVPLATLAALFFVANLFVAFSFLAVGPIARRIGLLNTMVFTHLPSNVLLALVPLMPTFPLAAGVLLMRMLISQMDVPTRQAYTMAVVAPEERTSAAAVTSLARSAGSSTSPVFAGLLLQGPFLGLPFLIAGALKVVQDIGLWLTFHNVQLKRDE
jgi:MFS family permease